MTRQLIVAGAVVIGLLGAYVFLTSAPPERDSSSTWRVPEFENLDRFELHRGELHLIVDRGAAGWRISEPLSFGASADVMEDVEGLFEGGEDRILVDHSKEASPSNLARYGFDGEDVLQVTLYDGGEVRLEFQVGQTDAAPTGASGTTVQSGGFAELNNRLGLSSMAATASGSTATGMLAEGVAAGPDDSVSNADFSFLSTETCKKSCFFPDT